MSMTLATTILDQIREGKASERLVLLRLAIFAKDDGAIAWPSLATLADRTGCSERTVPARAQVLENAG